MTRLPAAIAFLILFASTASAQALTNASLTGKYFFRHLLINANAAGAIVEMRTAYGAITFNGAGAYTYTGSQIIDRKSTRLNSSH